MILGWLGLDPQLTCILDWAYPTMGGSRKWLVIIMVLRLFLSAKLPQVQLGHEGYHVVEPPLCSLCQTFFSP